MPTKRYKIINPFYCFHPEIIFDGKPRPAFWGVEWTVTIKNGPQVQINIHCMRVADTKAEAESLVNELESIGGEFGSWQPWSKSAWYLSAQYKVASVNGKNGTIWRGHRAV